MLQNYGQLGKQDNCQAAVTLSIANHAASLPISYRLYLPQDWAADRVRRKKAGVPEDVAFATKPEIVHQHPTVTPTGVGKRAEVNMLRACPSADRRCDPLLIHIHHWTLAAPLAYVR